MAGLRDGIGRLLSVLRQVQGAGRLHRTALRASLLLHRFAGRARQIAARLSRARSRAFHAIAARRLRAPLAPQLSASLAMVFFLAGTTTLAVLPVTPFAHNWRLAELANASQSKETATPALATASLGPSDGMLLKALTPAIDDFALTQTLPITQTLAVREGDTLMGLLTEAGATAAEAHAAVLAMRPLHNPRQIRAGQEIEVTLAPPAGDGESEDEASPGGPASGRLLGLRVQIDSARLVEVKRDETGNYLAELFEKPLTERAFRASGEIESSLFLAADDAGIPERVTIELIRLFSYDIDFQREIHKGDRFEILFTQMLDEDGQAVDMGRILFATLTTKGKTHALYRFTSPADGSVDYYDEKGQSAKKFLMKTPIDGARLSSGFGMRHHPILGYSKMHKGADFAAPSGTPIMAAGQGMVELAGRNGSYGNYVRIRHANGYKTAYAHLRSFARGIRSGVRVRQGQIIGYVGSTGRSTGPHLHYEVLVNGKQVNPMSIRVPTGRKLAGTELAAFEAARAVIKAELAQATVLSPTATGGAAGPSTAITR